MSYSKTNWSDRVVETPNKYTMTDNGDGTVTLIPVPRNSNISRNISICK